MHVIAKNKFFTTKLFTISLCNTVELSLKHNETYNLGFWKKPLGI
jgi:hypothetical protein